MRYEELTLEERMCRWGILLVIVGCTDSENDVDADESDDVVATKLDTDATADTGPCTTVWNRPVAVDEVADIAALSGVCEITGSLSILPPITDLTGLESLQVVGGDVGFGGRLTNLDGLSGLTTVGGGLYVMGSEALVDLDGLAGLSFVGREVFIEDNPSLISLDGLAGITSLERGLYIGFNRALTDIGGISALTSVGGVLDISHNRSLCQSLVDAYVETVTVGGPTTRTPNDPGC